MKNHQEPDWEKLISDTIESALHSGDFTQLKQTLGTTFETVKKQTAEGLKRIDVQTGKIFTQAQGRQQTNPQQVRAVSAPTSDAAGSIALCHRLAKGRPTGFSPSKKP